MNLKDRLQEHIMLGKKLDEVLSVVVNLPQSGAPLPEGTKDHLVEAIVEYSGMHKKVMEELAATSFREFSARARVVVAAENMRGSFTSKDIAEWLVGNGLMRPVGGLVGAVSQHIRYLVSEGEIEVLVAPGSNRSGEYRYPQAA